MKYFSLAFGNFWTQSLYLTLRLVFFNKIRQIRQVISEKINWYFMTRYNNRVSFLIPYNELSSFDSLKNKPNLEFPKVIHLHPQHPLVVVSVYVSILWSKDLLERRRVLAGRRWSVASSPWQPARCDVGCIWRDVLRQVMTCAWRCICNTLRKLKVCSTKIVGFSKLNGYSENNSVCKHRVSMWCNFCDVFDVTWFAQNHEKCYQILIRIKRTDRSCRNRSHNTMGFSCSVIRLLGY